MDIVKLDKEKTKKLIKDCVPIHSLTAYSQSWTDIDKHYKECVDWCAMEELKKMTLKPGMIIEQVKELQLKKKVERLTKRFGCKQSCIANIKNRHYIWGFRIKKKFPGNNQFIFTESNVGASLRVHKNFNKSLLKAFTKNMASIISGGNNGTR